MGAMFLGLCFYAATSMHGFSAKDKKAWEEYDAALLLWDKQWICKRCGEISIPEAKKA